MGTQSMAGEGNVLKIAECLQLDSMVRYDPLIERLLEEGHPEITVDLGDLSAINALTIEKILLLEQELWRRGRKLRICGCHASVYSAFQYLKLDKFLHFISSCR